MIYRWRLPRGWIPFPELQEDLGELEEEVGKERWGRFIPLVDMYEERGNLVVKASLAGVKPEDVEIEITEDYLTIKGETKEEKEVKKESYFRKETRSGAFYRRLPLPFVVERDKAEAVSKNGLLTITIPKLKEAKEKVKKIKIKKK